MAVILPTPAELARMDWYKRDAVLRSIRALERDLGAAFVPADIRRYRMTPEQKQQRAAEITAREAAWGEAVRAEARRLAGECA